MAKKKENKQGFTEPQGFTHGMISDVDPHFQLTGSYSDAQNIRLTNAEGSTFTVENIEGNSLFVDLATTDMIHINAGQGGFTGESGNTTFFDVGPDGDDVSNNISLAQRASVVGSYSYANQILLIIVARYEYDRGGSNLAGGSGNNFGTYTPFEDAKSRTLFLLVDFNNNLKVTKVTDLRVCWTSSMGNYPDLGMKIDETVRVEAIVENGCISRIYWTDNKNPLRTLNINQERLDKLSIESLDITPLMSPSQPVLHSTISGSLPVGVYQYTYKYISENGGETTFSPLSNLYHVSDKAFGSSVTYGGGPKGNIGTQGFNINIYDVDPNFDYVELYALFYEDLNNAPRVSVVSRVLITNSSEVSFSHVGWNNELDNGLEEVLIDTNTWDICKDIAIKDNILFAANLKQKKNWISEKEWNVKVLRYCINTAGTSQIDAMLTTNDTAIKHYDGGGEIAEGATDDDGFICGHGQLLGQDGTMFDVAGHPYLQYDGNLNNPMWTTSYNQRHGNGGDDNRVKNLFEFRYLSDKMTLGAESFNYYSNPLGGCRVTFGISQREADQTKNPSSSPFISATTSDPSGDGSFEATPFSTDNLYDYQGQGTGSNTDGTNTTFQTSMALGGSKDPHAAGDRRGYQRGEVYRFGVQVFDLNGAPGNVLWIGDIQTPEQYDPLRMLRTWNSNYTPRRTTTSTVTAKHLVSHLRAQDHRLSYVYGHVVPPCEVEWYTVRNGGATPSTLDPYVDRYGELPDSQVAHGTTQTGLKSSGGRLKGITIGPFRDGGVKDHFDMYAPVSAPNHTHYLFDLFVHFEFAIPNDVCKKISGFRVVRAERKEEDRRIVQQGLLNQTVQYGDASKDLSYGYDETNFSAADNKAFDDDPVFVNPEVADGADPSPVEQPEYNTYLNGYLGLAEHSYVAWCDQGFDRSTSDPGGKVTTGGNTEGLVYYHPDHEDAKYYNNGQKSYAMPYHRDDLAQKGPGTIATHKRQCGYFGGLDKLSFKSHSAGEPLNETHAYGERDVGRASVSGSVFTLDSPDSAFGIRPYNFKSGDMLRIDCVLKLTDSERYNTLASPYYISGYFGHNLNTGNTGNNDGIWNSGGYYSEDLGVGTGTSGTHKAYAKDLTIKEALRFSSRQELNEDYGILIGKYYCWDTGYAINQEINGGQTAAKNDQGSSAGDRPKTRGQWLPISNSKEISDGEIVPSGFFKNSRKIKNGRASGFSNNTLGFVKSRTTVAHSCYIFGAIDKRISKYNGEDAGDIYGAAADVAWDEDKQAKDFNYDTVSTMQMGLRSILIELNNEIKNVRKQGSGDQDSYFRNTSVSGLSNSDIVEYLHDAWFAPQNLSVIYDCGHWNGYEKDMTTTAWNNRATAGGHIIGRHEDMARLNTVSNTGGLNAAEGYNETGQINFNGRLYNPHKYLCTIVRKITPYGGHNKSAIESTRYIPCGNFHPIKQTIDANTGDKQWHTSKVFGGDTFVNLYSHQKTSTPYMKKSMARWQVFPVESYVNTDMRSGLTLNNGDTEIGKEINKAPYSNDWLYNSVYSQENTIKSALMIDEDVTCENLDLPYEIAYSNTKVSGEPGDAFRQFPINQFHDMEGLYGEINRLVNFKNEIYVLQDSAFAKLLVNPLSMLSDDAGTSLFTGTGETVENHIYISTKYGSRHRSSVAMSEKSLYFVDTNFARLFKYDTEQLTSLGDALGQRNYLKNIIKEWEVKARRLCTRNTHGGDHDHGARTGKLDSTYKLTTSRNYFSDNPLKFLGITSIFDYKNKELLITFHNSAWGGTDGDLEGSSRLTFADPTDNHPLGNALDGVPIKISETLVYNESVNAFTSKYSVAPPQWLSGGQGSFIICPENEIDVQSLSQYGSNYDTEPYDVYGTRGGLSGMTGSGTWTKNYRPNPLRLWLWDKHEKGKKTNFFGKKDNILKFDNSGDGPDVDSPILDDTGGTVTEESYTTISYYGTKYVADESYIEKIITEDAGTRKTFDNVRIIMTPSEVPSYNQIGYSFADFSTETSGDNHGVIKNRWEFQNGPDGWSFWDGSGLEDFASFSSPPPMQFQAIVYGCTDPTATNYVSNATEDDGSCYTGSQVFGCTNSLADNYNSLANINNGSCIFSQTIDGCTDSAADNYNSLANNDDGSCYYIIFGCTDSGATNYNSLANQNDGSCTYPTTIYGCTDSAALNYDTAAQTDDGTCEYCVFGCMSSGASNYDANATCDDGSCTFDVYGCTDVNGLNWNSLANTDDGSCCYIAGCIDSTANNYDPTACFDDSSCTYTNGCTDSTMFNYDSTATVDDGSCTPFVYGCTDSTASNYNPSANTDDNSCIPCVYGCTDSGAFGYDSTATCNDGSCTPIVNGCTDSTALNYNSLANTDDGSCIPIILGCTDSAADNYDSLANTDDDSCTYPTITGCTDSTASNYDSLANTDDGSCIPCVDGCTDPIYLEYNSMATCDDGSCATLCVDGCTDPTAVNYNTLATCDDGSCNYCSVYGCTDPLAVNYDSTANCNDPNNACCYVSGCTDSTADNYDPNACYDDGSCTYTPAAGGSFSAKINGSGNTGTCATSFFMVISNNAAGYGSHYDPNLTHIDGTWTNTWSQVTTTHTTSFEIIQFRDLDNGVNVNSGDISAYILGTGQWVNNPHPNINWGIKHIRLYNTAFSSGNTSGCTWAQYLHWNSQQTVTADTPTNPYNLP